MFTLISDLFLSAPAVALDLALVLALPSSSRVPSTKGEYRTQMGELAAALHGTVLSEALVLALAKVC